MKSADPRYVTVRLARVRLERAGRLVLRDVNWTIRPGERWILAGGNGAGKTQLLKLVSGAVWPTPANEIRRYFWRNEIWPTPLEVQEEIGYLGPERQDKYERYGWNHTVAQIVGTGLYRTDIPLDPVTAADRRRIDAVLRRLALDQLAQRPFLTLSYGERRLALLARVLASRPRLLLLDELMNGLDATNRSRAMRWLERTAASKLPWVLATHRLEDVPRAATHALVLDRGSIVYRGVLRRAPLARWLEHSDDLVRASQSSGSRARPRLAERSSPQLAASAPAGPSATLVKLTRASVYLDQHLALEKVSLAVSAGECWVIHGPNGSGKTTLLRALYGDHSVAAGGRVERIGVEPGVPLEGFRKRVGLVAAHLQARYPQNALVSTVVQSGRHASIGLNEVPSTGDRNAARRTLAFFGLSALSSRSLRELSYGQLRRVLFARAWVNRPQLLLLDEPFAGVDAPTRRLLMRHVQDMAGTGTAVVIATHHRNEWPPCATHELELREGSVVYCGPVRVPMLRRASS